ncbi:MAG TPA: ribosome-associated translation inhibitor RaiA [Thermoanaerobaculia bacterium]|jgi:putative sigma-54 modulation protein|nr:ribosome-associated translation inhibitor RaiA [Thermoanaerobaculia bacterium]
MHTEIVGRNAHIDDGLRELVESKLHKLEKFLSEPLEARVTLTAEKHSFIAELHVSHRDGVLQGHDETDSGFQEAVQRTVAKVEEAARRAHQKGVDQRRHGGDHGDHGDRGKRWPVEILAQDTVGEGRAPRVIESSHMDIKPMTLDDAALELESSEHVFVVFHDATTGRLSVLYKRKDHHYGLIAPEL